MNANFVAPYLTDPRDRAVLGAVPLVMAPRFGTLPALEVGHTRFIGGEHGIYLEARSKVIHATMLMSEVSLPYGRVEPAVRIVDADIDENLLARARALAARACPQEWAGLLLSAGNGTQELWTPAASESSEHRVSYSASGVDPLNVLVDIHSHGRLPAFWSATDDADDRANPSPVFFSAVIGNADQAAPSFALRLVVAGRFFVLQPGGADPG